MKLLVIEEHRSNYPNPITFKTGDPLVLGRRDREFPGWIWVATADGNQGWAPEQYLSESEHGGSAVATADYDAVELCTEPGEFLLLHHQLNGWAWVENARGMLGWVPLNTTSFE